jgi:hypothetical protein
MFEQCNRHNREVRIHRSRTAVTAVAAVYGVICIALSPPGPFTTPDSAAYLAMDPIVPIGYPAFLHLTGADAAIRIQPLIFAVSLGALGLELLTLTGSVVVALAVQLGIIAIPGLRDLHATILTESIFMSGVMGFLAAAFSFLRVPSLPGIVLAASVAAATGSLRRVGWALVPVLLLLLLARRRGSFPEFLSVAGIALLPLAAVATVDAIATVAVHGDRTTSLAGRHAFAKAALLDADVRDIANGTARASLEEALATTFVPIRDLLAAAPPPARPTLTLYYETCLQGPCVAALRESLAALPEARQNELFADAGWERIRAAPLGFLRLLRTHYSLLWMPYHWRNSRTTVALNAFIAQHRPLPFEREAFKVGPQEPLVFAPLAGVVVVQALFASVGWVTGGLAIWGAIAVLWRRSISVEMLAAAIAAAVAHGCLLLSALAAAGLARFTIAVLPAVVVSLGLAIWVVGKPLVHRVAMVRRARYH